MAFLVLLTQKRLSEHTRSFSATPLHQKKPHMAMLAHSRELQLNGLRPQPPVFGTEQLD